MLVFCFVWLFINFYYFDKLSFYNICMRFEILCICYAIWGMAGLEIYLWRSWQAAISLGEEHASFEPGIAEWDSYVIFFIMWSAFLWIGNLLNWNILVGRGRENNCDAVSNVERRRCRTNWIPLGNLWGDVVLWDFSHWALDYPCLIIVGIL